MEAEHPNDAWLRLVDEQLAEIRARYPQREIVREEHFRRPPDNAFTVAIRVGEQLKELRLSPVLIPYYDPKYAGAGRIADWGSHAQLWVAGGLEALITTEVDVVRVPPADATPSSDNTKRA